MITLSTTDLSYDDVFNTFSIDGRSDAFSNIDRTLDHRPYHNTFDNGLTLILSETNEPVHYQLHEKITQDRYLLQWELIPTLETILKHKRLGNSKIIIHNR